MQAKGKKGELLKRAVQELLEDTRKTVLSLLTNSENFGTLILNQFVAPSKSEIQCLAISVGSHYGKIKAHKSAFKKDILLLQMQ
jgi:hypothetical protein